MTDRSFDENLTFSRGTREATDIETLKAMIPGCLSVVKTGEDMDRLHVDYVANLRKGAVLHIDGKARRPGASRFWKNYVRGRHDVPSGEPDVAIETWSVKPTDQQEYGRAGWTFDESSDTDLILYTFDPSDSREVILLSFPLLRIAARRFIQEWTPRFGLKTQNTTNTRGVVLWQSECLLVPALIVQEAIRNCERGSVKTTGTESGADNTPATNEMAASEIQWGMIR